MMEVTVQEDRNYDKENLLAVAEACMAIFWSTPGKGRLFVKYLSSQQSGPWFLRPQYLNVGFQDSVKIKVSVYTSLVYSVSGTLL